MDTAENVQELHPDVAQQLADIDSLADDFQPPAETGDTEGQQAQGQATGVMCAGLLSVLFTIMAARRGEHWALTDKESEQLGNALGAVLDKYMPGFNAGPEAALLMVTLVLVMPRVAIDAKLKRERKVEEKDSEKTQSRQDKRQQQQETKQQQTEQPAPASGEGKLWFQDKAA